MLKSDLELYFHGFNNSGEPLWVIFEPISNKYHHISWKSYEIIKRMIRDPSVNSIVQQVNDETLLKINDSDVKSLIVELSNFGLLENNKFTFNEPESKQNIIQTASKYFFYRLPLFKPDKFLNFLIKYTDFLFTFNFIRISLVAFFIGAFGLISSFDEFKSTIINSFNLSGFTLIVLCTIFIKIFHELGHALVAKKYGCSVPVIGIFFIIFFPLPYTDVNESWKLSSNNKRLLISSAGLITEFIIAGWALFFWFILPDYDIRQFLVYIFTISLISTVIININPFMKFDGYYILSDYLGIPNLHTKSLDIFKWRLRSLMFKSKIPFPEKNIYAKRHLFFIFGLLTICYRVFIYFSLAILIYLFLYKPLGIVFFIFELWIFILKPIFHEMIYWKKNNLIKSFNKSFILLFFFLLFTAALFPSNKITKLPAVLKPSSYQNYYSIDSAKIYQTNLVDGKFYKKDEVLLIAAPENLVHEYNKTKVLLKNLNNRVTEFSNNNDVSFNKRSYKAKITELEAKLAGMNEEFNSYRFIAPFDGYVSDLIENFNTNDFIYRNQKLFTFSNRSHWIVETYIDEYNINRINNGNHGVFYSSDITKPSISLKVTNIDQTPINQIQEKYLLSIYGGSIPARTIDNSEVLEKKFYKVTLNIDTNIDYKIIEKGYVEVDSKYDFWIVKITKQIFSAISKELYL